MALTHNSQKSTILCRQIFFSEWSKKLSTDKNVTETAISIPIIPNKFPCLEVSGEDNPLKAKMNKTPEIRYKDAERFADINYLSFFFFLYMASIL